MMRQLISFAPWSGAAFGLLRKTSRMRDAFQAAGRIGMSGSLYCSG
jgi:hypothetical protein